MKAILIVPLFALAAGPVSAQAPTDDSAASAAAGTSPAVAAIGMLPKQRVSKRLAPSERNPFAEKVKDVARAVSEDTETQESKIRAIFKALNGVAGVRKDRDGRLMALAGDLILREGEEVKPVMKEQTEVLTVSKIDDKKVELTFVENKDGTQPRTIVLLIKGQPLVSEKLYAQPKGARDFYISNKKATVAGVTAALAAAPAVSGSSPGSPASLAVGNHEVPPTAVVQGIGKITVAGTPAPTPPEPGPGDVAHAPPATSSPATVPVVAPAPPPAAPSPAAPHQPSASTPPSSSPASPASAMQSVTTSVTSSAAPPVDPRASAKPVEREKQPLRNAVPPPPPGESPRVVE